MPITFKNIRLVLDGTVGEISTLTEWQVWKCLDKKWASTPPVVLRNVMLAGLHPTLEFCIGEISNKATDYRLLNSFKPPDHSKAYFLDLASNSRNHGHFTFAQTPVGKRYYGEDKSEQWKRIIYGSILHTGCKKMVYKAMTFIIVDDENRDSDGNYLDDAVNNVHWGTGDSHAKANLAMMQLLGLGNVDSGVVDPNVPLQFRAALWGEWVAKGTVAYQPMLDGFGAALAIPLSCLKGNKPALGNHQGKLLVGLVFEAEQRRAKPGWMLFQWFAYETLEQDNIISRMVDKCDRLSKAYNSITQLAEILRIDQSEAEAQLEDSSDTLQSEAEYENTMIRIIQADKNGILLLHPYVVRRVKERLQAVWLNLAKAAGVRFYSVMAQPDESLAHYHVVLPDGRIVGQRVFCAPDFAEGEYIVFCNPMRHWGDCQLWTNQHEGTYVNTSGIMAAPRKLLLNLGRDTDGDFVQLIKSSAYPKMREAIAAFADPPNVTKLPKVALSGNLQQIAIRSMNNLTGIVASLLARSRAGSEEQTMLLIPPGGQQTEPKEMRIIDFLSQELQIAVDSLKSAYPNNTNGLDAVKAYLDSVNAEAPWLKDFKDLACYRDRTCAVNPNATDTISRLVQLVNSYWKSPSLPMDSSPKVYEKVLFSDITLAQAQLDYALEHRTRYREAIAKAIEWKDANDGDTRLIREVAESTKASKEVILQVKDSDGNTYSPQSWTAAYWVVSHQANTGDAGLVFMIFADEVIGNITNMKPQENKVIKVYGVQHGAWSAPQITPWSGQEVQIRAYMREVSGRQHLALEMKWELAKINIGWFHLGIVGETYTPYMLPGVTKTMKIYSTRFKDGRTTEVTLFDQSMEQDEINDYLNFR